MRISVVHWKCKKLIFSKSKMNIKNLAREILYIDPYFPRMRGIDHKSRFQGHGKGGTTPLKIVKVLQRD